MWVFVFLVALTAQDERPARPAAEYEVDSVEEAVARQQEMLYGPFDDPIDVIIDSELADQPLLPIDIQQLEMGRSLGPLRLRVLFAWSRYTEPYLLIDELRAWDYRPDNIRFSSPESTNTQPDAVPILPRTVRITGQEITQAMGSARSCSLQFRRWISPMKFELEACGVQVQIERQSDGTYRLSYVGNK